LINADCFSNIYFYKRKQNDLLFCWNLLISFDQELRVIKI
jgi:chemotaxis methyl-accepting protein methylase